MLVQRRGDDHHDWSLYEGSGQVGVEWYFQHANALGPHVMLYHLEPGAEEGVHFHEGGNPESCSTDSSDELYVVTLGEVVMTVDDARVVLRAGDAIYAPAGARHGVVNESERPAELILVWGSPRH